MPKKSEQRDKSEQCDKSERRDKSESEQKTTRRPSATIGTREKARLEKIWSRQMALEGLKRIYEAALEGARQEICDEDGALVEVKFNPTAANAATKAIEAANKMLGYTAPEEDEGEGGLLLVELGEAEEFAG